MSSSVRIPERQDDPSRAEVWAMFVAAFVPRLGEIGSDSIGLYADELLREYDKRWSPDQDVKSA